MHARQLLALGCSRNMGVQNFTLLSFTLDLPGTIKRWNFARGPMSHGSRNHRRPGSIGAGTDPGRVFKGKKMAGRMGNVRIKARKVKVRRHGCPMQWCLMWKLLARVAELIQL